MSDRLLFYRLAQMLQGKNQGLPRVNGGIAQNILGIGDRLRRIRHKVNLQVEYGLEFIAHLYPFIVGEYAIVPQRLDQYPLQFEIDPLQPDHQRNVAIDRGQLPGVPSRR